MKYYLVCFGQTVSPGVSLDGTLPAGAVVCTQAQYENYQSWAISNGALVAATPPTLTLAQQAATALAAAQKTTWNEFGSMGSAIPAAWSAYQTALRAIVSGTDTTSTALPAAPAT